MTWPAEMMQEARRLYVDEKLHAQQVGDRLGIGADLVCKWLERMGVTRRTAAETAMINGSPWTPDRVALLKQWWDEGVSTAKIARALGITKNSVVSKAHRLELKPRPNPISGRRRSQIIKAANGSTRRATLKPSEPRTKQPRNRMDRCQWPLWGDDERPTGEFCGAEVTPGSSYCDHHYRRSVVPAAREPARGVG